jgi:uncharacterized protein
MNAIRSAAACAARIGLMGVLLAGCATTPPAQFYTLAPLQAPEAKSVSTPRFTLAVGPVIMPELLQRPQIVTRNRDDQVNFAAFHRWAGTLADETKRVLAVNLGTLLYEARAVVTTDDLAIDPDRRVVVNINRFDGVPGGAVWLNAVWTLTSRKGENTLAVHQSVIEEKVAGAAVADLVSAHSRAVGRLSREIAAGVTRTLPAP